MSRELILPWDAADLSIIIGFDVLDVMKGSLVVRSTCCVDRPSMLRRPRLTRIDVLVVDGNAKDTPKTSEERVKTIRPER
jgi:hypothetical protein